MNWETFINNLQVDHTLALEDMPEVDLYMDQVIQLFDKKFAANKRHEDEKNLTKTMINNYAKGKLLFPIENKRYSKSHLILISLIYQLKGALSIKDIKRLLNRLNDKITDDAFHLEDIYASYLRLTEKNVSLFKQDISASTQDVEQEGTQFDSDPDKEYLEYLLVIVSLVNMSNFYRRAAEKLVDQMNVDEKE